MVSDVSGVSDVDLSVLVAYRVSAVTVIYPEPSFADHCRDLYPYFWMAIRPIISI